MLFVLGACTIAGPHLSDETLQQDLQNYGLVRNCRKLGYVPQFKILSQKYHKETHRPEIRVKIELSFHSPQEAAAKTSGKKNKTRAVLFCMAEPTSGEMIYHPDASTAQKTETAPQKQEPLKWQLARVQLDLPAANLLDLAGD